MNDFGLYVVMTSPSHNSYESLTEICVRCGVRMLQLRDKSLCDRDLFVTAKNIASITRNSDTKFIVNDRIDMALAAGADGVHLGQDDLNAETARSLAPDLIVGVSTHTPEQASVALKCGPDYIAFGPVYPTPAKKGRDKITGTGHIQELKYEAQIPVVAIGGINETNIVTVLESGARNIALIRAADRPDSESAIRLLQLKISENTQ